MNTGDTFYLVTNQDLQDNYDQSEIDYARILMMNGVYVTDTDNSYLHVNDSLDIKHSTFPSAFGNFEFISDLDLTLLRFDFADAMERESIFIYYTTHGDGHITTYQLDDIEFSLDRDVNEMEQEVLSTAETVYVNPSEPYLVADFIERVEFVYE